jgi:hypothetical protein
MPEPQCNPRKGSESMVESPSEPAQELAENGVRVGYPTPGTDERRSSGRPWWRRMFGG